MSGELKRNISVVDRSYQVPVEDLYIFSLESLNLSVTPYNVLTRAGIKTFGQVIEICESEGAKDKLLEVKGFGPKGIKETLEKLSAIMEIQGSSLTFDKSLQPIFETIKTSKDK
jgi:DNA-directed RNA polymerase alpha subunit